MISLRTHAAPLCAAMLLLGACTVANPQTDAVLSARGDLPVKAAVAGVRFQPFVEQEGAPGALAMALDWSGSRTEATFLVSGLSTQDKRGDIIETVSRRGRVAYPVGDLRALLNELAAGHPVLALQEPSGKAVPVWRYTLIVGYDLEQGMLRVHSGVLKDLKLPIGVFERNWERAENWAVVVLPPERLPASAAERTYLLAAQALVSKGTAWEAVVAHDSALSTWPASAEAMMGLGHSLRALGDESGAESAYRSARKLILGAAGGLQTASAVQ